MLLSQVASSDMAVALAGGEDGSPSGKDKNEAEDQAEKGSIPMVHLLARFPGLVLNGLNSGGSGDASVAAMRAEIQRDMGAAALLDVSCVIGMFNGINRVADMCGIKLDSLAAPFAEAILGELKMDAASNWTTWTSKL